MLTDLVTTNSQGLGAMLRPDETASAFASDITRRIKTAPQAPSESTTEVDDSALAEEAGRKQSQLEKLESALSQTVSWMAEKHGDKAATALMGIVYKRLGEGEVTEASLGDAFLDVTRFIDKQFGTEAGDDFLDHLNGSLNDSLNAFFENGLSEQFMAVTSPTGLAGTNLAPGAADDLLAQIKDAVKQILDDIKEARPETGQTPEAGPYQQQPASSMIGVMKDVMV